MNINECASFYSIGSITAEMYSWRPRGGVPLKWCKHSQRDALVSWWLLEGYGREWRDDFLVYGVSKFCVSGWR